MLKMLDPLADVLFDTTADALSTINENIVQLRDEMNERIDELESRLDYSTKQILNKIKNQTFISGMGTELDKLHTSVTGIAGQIEVLKKDTSMSEEERAINIAAQIGSNTEWNRDGSLVFRIKTLGNVLAGRSFADMEGRDFPSLFCVSTAYLRGSSISARTLTASLSASEMQCRYFCVVSNSECPSRCWTCRMLMPPYAVRKSEELFKLCFLFCRPLPGLFLFGAR